VCGLLPQVAGVNMAALVRRNFRQVRSMPFAVCHFRMFAVCVCVCLQENKREAQREECGLTLSHSHLTLEKYCIPAYEAVRSDTRSPASRSRRSA
jgi:hypothetical protein